jgi:hypothetical protein
LHCTQWLGTDACSKQAGSEERAIVRGSKVSRIS